MDILQSGRRANGQCNMMRQMAQRGGFWPRLWVFSSSPDGQSLETLEITLGIGDYWWREGCRARNGCEDELRVAELKGEGFETRR
jgi:hypothetical protein